jgi:RHS repeat-associated protein
LEKERNEPLPQSHSNPHQGTHQECHLECEDAGVAGKPLPDNLFPPPENCEWVCETVPNYNLNLRYRGNLTKVASFSDATLASDPNASVRTMEYDMTGNVIEASMSCCNVKSIEYSAANQYAYPTKETKGVGTQLVTSAVYDRNTGLVVSSKDENDQSTTYTYDTVTLRQTRVDYPNGAWATSEINDTQFPYYIKTISSLDSNRSISSWSFFDGAGRGFRTRSLTANGYISSDIEFDEIGMVKRTYNPYTVAALNTERPEGIKFSEVTLFDSLGRTLRTKLPDDTIVEAQYSGLVATMTDQAGKKRRQTMDALGRLIRVDEPNADGLLDVGGVPAQPTYYEYDGNDNLTKVTQSVPGVATQERLFKYDSLSRLTHEKQVEATATLDNDGNKPPSGGLWTGFYKYTTEGLLDYGVDARGVKTDLSYDGLNRVQSVAYTGETGYLTPNIEYTYGDAEAGFYNIGRLTKVRTPANVGQGTPETIHNYDYDKIGQVVKHSQSIGNQTYELEYGYNLAGQLVSEKYPSGKIVSMTVDDFGVTQTIADAQRTYVNGVTSSVDVNGATSQITLGNGTTETFTLNNRFQMESQSLKKGTDVLQKYDYKYGKIQTNGDVDATKNNGQLGRIESFIGANKQSQQRFEYDSIGRLSQSSEHRGDNGNLTYKQVFDFDRFGNLYRKAASNPPAGQQNPLPYTAIEEADINKAKNQFATGTTYDDAGNVIADNKFRTMSFAYDANGRNVKVSRSGVPDALTVYDANGNRVATKVNDIWQYMVYDAFGKLVAEYGQLSDGLGGVKYIQQDGQGSVRTVTNANGFVVARTDHQAFGGEVGYGVGQRAIEHGYNADKTTRQGYGLTENDAGSGQQHTWFRKLETSAGRWSSPDPYKGSMSLDDPQSFNRYSYVQSDPTNAVDPSGRMCSYNPLWESPSEQWVNCWESWEGSWVGYDPPDKPIHEPGGDPPPPPAPDPCAGKKGSLDYDKRRDTADPNGNWTPRDHITYNHIRNDVEQGKSKYTNSLTPSFAPNSAIFTAVTALNQATFQLATGYRQYNGNIAYLYAVPATSRALFPVSLQATVGTDSSNGNQHTNVNTLIVKDDCKTVVTSFPGLPGGVKSNDPRIHGTAGWWPNVPTIETTWR